MSLKIQLNPFNINHFYSICEIHKHSAFKRNVTVTDLFDAIFAAFSGDGIVGLIDLELHYLFQIPLGIKVKKGISDME